MFVKTNEQARLLRARHGLHICAANAGTGKTQVSAELVVDLYEEEEARRQKVLGRANKERLQSADQSYLLGCFLILTFSRKAAAELDDRIKSIMRDRSIPVPQQRLCFTFDSYLIGTFRKNRVFNQFLRAEPRARTSLDWLKQTLPSSVFEELENSAKNSKYATSIHKKLWLSFSWIQDGSVYKLILDALIRADQNASLSSRFTIEAIYKRFGEYVGRSEIRKKGSFEFIEVSEFWKSEVRAWERAYKSLDDLVNKKTEGMPLTDSEECQAKEHQQIVQLRDEVLAFYGISRAFNYDPDHNPRALCNSRLVEAFCGLDELKSIRLFLRVSKVFNDWKFKFLMMDFSDHLFYFNGIIRADSSLLERDLEYPKLGIRRKYVIWDEVQDNSNAQHKILESFIARDDVNHLVAIVGDFKQSIYEWRGSDPFNFRKKVQAIREELPMNFHPMTCCFRSAKSIVELGNQIVSKLPTYREYVIPSATKFKEDGEISVAPPHENGMAEALWVLEDISKVRKSQPKASCMLLFRNAPFEHEGWHHISNFLNRDPYTQAMTIHKSKGAQADHVYILSCNSGSIPSPRGGWDQEVNLFYVGCTRARWRLVLNVCGVEKKNSSESQILPSLFFGQVPILKKAMLSNPLWNQLMINEGVKQGNLALSIYLDHVAKRKIRVNKEMVELFDEQMKFQNSANAGDIGSAGIANEHSESLDSISLKEMSDATNASVNQTGVSEALPSLIHQCAESFRSKGTLPKSLNPYEIRTLLKMGLAERTQGAVKFSSKGIRYFTQK